MKGTAKAIKVGVEANFPIKLESPHPHYQDAAHAKVLGRGANAAFMAPRTVKIMDEQRPRGPCRGVTGKLTTDAARTFDSESIEGSSETQK